MVTMMKMCQELSRMGHQIPSNVNPFNCCCDKNQCATLLTAILVELEVLCENWLCRSRVRLADLGAKMIFVTHITAWDFGVVTTAPVKVVHEENTPCVFHSQSCESSEKGRILTQSTHSALDGSREARTVKT